MYTTEISRNVWSWKFGLKSWKSIGQDVWTLSRGGACLARNNSAAYQYNLLPIFFASRKRKNKRLHYVLFPPPSQSSSIPPHVLSCNGLSHLCVLYNTPAKGVHYKKGFCIHRRQLPSSWVLSPAKASLHPSRPAPGWMKAFKYQRCMPLSWFDVLSLSLPRYSLFWLLSPSLWLRLPPQS